MPSGPRAHGSMSRTLPAGSVACRNLVVVYVVVGGASVPAFAAWRMVAPRTLRPPPALTLLIFGWFVPIQ